MAEFGGKVLAGTDGKGILVSSDKGKSWAFDATFPGRKVRCLLSLRGNLYAGTDAEGVFVFTNGDQKWIGLSSGLPDGAQVFAMTGLDGVLFAGLYSNGLYALDDQKKSWSKVGGVTPLALASTGSTLIAGHNPGGLYWSGDLGAKWSKGTAKLNGKNPINPAFPEDDGELEADAPVWELASDDSMVFAGAAAGIYHSADGGRSWTRSRSGLPKDSPGIAFLMQKALVLAATPIKGKNAGEPIPDETRVSPRQKGD